MQSLIKRTLVVMGMCLGTFSVAEPLSKDEKQVVNEFSSNQGKQEILPPPTLENAPFVHIENNGNAQTSPAISGESPFSTQECSPYANVPLNHGPQKGGKTRC